MSIGGPGFRIPNDNTHKNMLLNYEGGWFTISELEVWQVTILDD
jgi:hypothetical protein